MGTHRHDEDDGFEQLLEGSAQARERFPELGSFVDDVQAITAVSPAAETRHIVAMMAEAQLIADKGDPVARPVSNAHGPAPQVSGLPMRRSTQMVKMLLTKVMAPLVAVFTVMGGLAYAQALPTPLQDAVSSAAGAVGIDLPDSDTADDEVVDDEVIDDDATDDQADDVAEDAETDDQGEDDQGDDDRSGSGGDDDQTPGDDQDDDDQGDDDDSGSGGSGGSDDQGDDDDSDEDNSGHGGGSEDSDDGDDDHSGSGGSDDSDDDSDDDSGSGGGSDDEGDDDSD